ncbi:MAG: tetratricopeptide repeat protein [bacterium]
MRIKHATCALIFIWLLCIATRGDAIGPDPNSNDPLSFTTGYKLFEKKKFEKACPHFFRYMSVNSPDIVDYEWAEFFFGICLKKCGYSHAAVDILAHLVTRKPNTKIVSYCLELFEEITRTQPFDNELIIHSVLCDQEYGFVNEEIGDFINFYQGVYDWKHGFFEWGNEHFKNITPEGYYFYKYLYHKALYRVYQDHIDDAIALLTKILEGPSEEKALKDDARKTLARLLYEKKEYDNSALNYQKITKSILDQAQNLLERAWVQYRLGYSEKAMGLLYAFEAPSFQNYFTPEYFILKSLIYKDVCHYKRALDVVKEFNKYYGDSLESIYNRGKAVDNPALLLVLLSKNQINKTWKLLRLVEKEKEKCAEFKKKEKALYDYLLKIYDLQIEESADSLKEQIEKEFEKIANTLLQYEEEAHLMEYEIGIDMYQRVYQYHYSEDNTKKKKAGEKIAVYPFQGEFWNNELADYKVTLPNKCECIEEWDIFFQ